MQRDAFVYPTFPHRSSRRSKGKGSSIKIFQLAIPFDRREKQKFE